MFHYFGTITNTKGDSLVGWQVEVVQLADGSTVVPIFADENSTPIVTASGVDNRAVSDADGNYDFFIPIGDYSLRYYDGNGVFQRLQRYLSMYGAASTDAIASAAAAAASETAAAAARDAAVAASETPALAIQTNPATPTVPPSGVSSGSYYWVVSSDGLTLTLYLNTSGTGAAVAGPITQPLKGYLDAQVASIDATAAAAEALIGPTYASTAAGLAATSDGQGFAVDNGDGTVTIYLNSSGSAVAQRTLATIAALAATTGAALSGFRGQTVYSKLDNGLLDPLDFGAHGDGTDDTAALIDALATGKPVYVHQHPDYLFGFAETLLPTARGLIGGGKLKMLTGAGAFDANSYHGATYPTNQVGIYLNGLTDPMLDIELEMEGQAAVRTAFGVLVNQCVRPNIRLHAYGFQEAEHGILSVNTSTMGRYEARVHDCTTDDISLGSMQLTAISFDENHIGGAYSYGPEIHYWVKDVVLGAAARALYGEQSDGLNLQTIGWLGARVFGYAENVGEPFDCFADGVTAFLTVKDAINYGVKLVHGASHNVINASIDGTGGDGVVINGDSDSGASDGCGRNRVFATMRNVGALGYPHPITSAFGVNIDGPTATHKPHDNYVNAAVLGDGVNMNYAAMIQAGDNNLIEVGGAGYASNFGVIAGTAGTGNLIRRQAGAHLNAYNSTGPSLANGATIIFDTVLADDTAEYNAATGVMTLNCSGRYRIRAQASCGLVPAQKTFGVSILAGGVHIAERTLTNADAANAWAFDVAVEAVVDLDAGDSISAEMLTSSVANLTLQAGQPHTFLQVDQL